MLSRRNLLLSGTASVAAMTLPGVALATPVVRKWVEINVAAPAYQMNCVRPAVSALEEFRHRTRNHSPQEIGEFKRSAQLGIKDPSHTEHERGIIDCWRDVLRESDPSVTESF